MRFIPLGMQQGIGWRGSYTGETAVSILAVACISRNRNPKLARERPEATTKLPAKKQKVHALELYPAPVTPCMSLSFHDSVALRAA